MGVAFLAGVLYFCSMKSLIAILALAFANPVAEVGDNSIPTDTLHIESIEITASLKSDDALRTPIASTQLSMSRIERMGVSSIKDVSLIAPNFYQPNYGSSITSSIYVRGFGSRIDQPVLGVTIDDIPLMNKNAYDFDFYDIRKLELLRGPQGTLYGRNTSGGVMNITTLSPLSWQGLRAMAEYSTMTSYRASVAYYTKPRDNFGISAAAHFNHDGGYFRNTYTDQMCDRGNNASARLRMQWLLRDNWSLDNSLTWGYTKEGGYAYHHLNPTTNTTEAVAYNDPAGYERIAITEGFVAKYQGEKILFSSATSYQYLNDVMTLDQDFTPKSMFTMQQKQREHTITEEVVVRNADRTQRWQWLTGAFAFAKWLDMSSPVTFKRDGIDELILGNINNGIHTVFPNNNMLIGGDNFVINSDFNIPTYGAALYHQSSYRLGNWQLTAGIRFDLEHTSMRYNSNATIPYMFDMTMSDYRDLYSEFKGRERQLFFEILPKIAAEYNFDRGSAYATITRGYKAGGFNTQIFSDILQAKMMNDMMSALGIALDDVGGTTYDSASATRYKPETSWNFELGTHLRPTAGLNIDAALFWIECFDQQVTVLPHGKNTGRMMSNAARARSFGAELSIEYGYEGFTIRGDYGYTNARFREYNDGHGDYAGNRLPYAPEHTALLMASYSWWFNHPVVQSLTLSADWRGTGSIYWNEANTRHQPFYSMLGAQATLRMNNIELTIWGRNLTNTEYDVFYFKSVGEEFFSKGTPIHAGIKLNITL